MERKISTGLGFTLALPMFIQLTTLKVKLEEHYKYQYGGSMYVLEVDDSIHNFKMNSPVKIHVDWM
jgi:hypothetical protein